MVLRVVVVIKRGCIQPSCLSPYELVCAIQTVEQPKTRLDYINDIIESLAYDNKCDKDDDLFGKSIVSLPRKKERDSTVCSDKSNLVTGGKRSRTVLTECKKGVHAKCSLKHNCI